VSRGIRGSQRLVGKAAGGPDRMPSMPCYDAREALVGGSEPISQDQGLRI